MNCDVVDELYVEMYYILFDWVVVNVGGCVDEMVGGVFDGGKCFG